MRLYKWKDEFDRKFNRRKVDYVRIWEIWAKDWMRRDSFLVPRVDAFYYTFDLSSYVRDDPSVKQRLVINTPSGRVYLLYYCINPEEQFREELRNFELMQKQEAREELLEAMRGMLWECLFLIDLKANECGTLEVIFNLFNPFERGLDLGVYTYFMFNHAGLIVYNEVETHEYLSIGFPPDVVYRIDSSEGVALRILGFEGERASEEMVKKWFETCRRMKEAVSKMRGSYVIVKH